MIDNVNDSLECAEELAVLLKQIPFVEVNLIPYNPVEGIGFQKPSEEKCLAFKKVLVGAGYKTIIRTTKGLDAEAACGMLSAKS